MENERKSYGGSNYESQHLNNSYATSAPADAFSALPLSPNTFPPQQPSPYPTGHPSDSYGSYFRKENSSEEERRRRSKSGGRSTEVKELGRFRSFVAGLNTRNQVRCGCVLLRGGPHIW